MADKKFYWLKLKNDFFKRHDIKIIEHMTNGKDYVLFYLKLLLESINHVGHLRFSETIPYNEAMLSAITNTNIDIVRSAMKILIELKMVEVLDDETIYLKETEKMVGSESEWAKKKRDYRERLIGDTVRTLSSGSPDDVRQEIEIDKEIDKEIEIDESRPQSGKQKATRHKHGAYSNVLLSDADLETLQTEFPADFETRIERLSEYIASTGKSYKNHLATIRAWARKDKASEPVDTSVNWAVGP